jgi:ABC-2 type transport system ATP-binding protein
MSAVLQFQQVCKKFSDIQVLDCIDLEVQAGEFFGLVGVNGAGKTTLIKSVLDFCEIDHGDIKLFGIAHTQPHARTHLAFLPEQFTPPAHLTGRQFLEYIVNMHGLTYQHEYTEFLCREADLAIPALSQLVKSYSKGMAQKLGLVACFCSNKPLLILDEPMNGLDPKARVYLKKYLLQLKAQGITVFFSTHLLADVESLCDRMGILHEGKLRFIGTPQVCCEQFATQQIEEAYLSCIQ